MMRNRFAHIHFVAVITLGLLGSPALGQRVEDYRVWPDGPEDVFYNLGSSLAIDGDWAVAGDSAAGTNALQSTGAVIVYRRTEEGWARWQTLSVRGLHVNSRFGHSVDLHGDELLVGSLFGGFGNEGRVDIFHLVNEQWVEVQQLRAFDGAASYGFGHSVAFDAETLVVGSPSYPAGIYPQGGHGVCYVYEKSPAGWVLSQQLAHPDHSTTPYVEWEGFGSSCSVEGDLIVVGASFGGALGMAFVYRKSSGGWQRDGDLHLPQFPLNTMMHMGYSVEVSGGTVAVGAPSEIAGGSLHLGPSSVWVFDYDPLLQLWGLTQGFRASDVNLTPSGRDLFGRSLALRGDRLVVGAMRGSYNGQMQGTGYLFERENGVWNEVQRFVNSDPNPYPDQAGSPSFFGIAVAMDAHSGRILIGAQNQIPSGFSGNVGSAYFFDLNQGTVVCDGFPNETDAATRLTVTGNRGVSQTNVALAAYDAPPGRMGMFLVGPGGTPVPFSTGGSLCVGQPFARLTGIITIGPRGSAMHQLDFTSPIVSSLVIPGAQLTFQFLHRDVSVLMGVPSINASDAVEVLFE